MVLIIGTITAISPSFITGANAQTQPYYGYNSYESEYADKKDSIYEPRYETDNNNYKKSYGEDSYGPEYPSKYTDSNSYGPEYPSKYTDSNSYGPEYPSKYTDSNSYEPTTPSYGNDNNDNRKSYETNSYEPTTSYGMDDNNYQKNYENDNSYDKSQYQSSSYKTNYKPQYPSYGKDDRDKSKDDSSDIINKIKCTTNNINVNGDITGDVSLGNKGQVEPTPTEEGYLDANSYGSGNDGERHNGYQKDKGFTCIINNNNNIIVSAGNATDGGGNVTGQCAIDIEACFAQFLNTTEFQQLTNALNDGITVQIGENTVTLNSFADMCDALEGLTFEFDSLIGAISDIAFQAGILSLGGGIFECIAEALGIPITPTLAPASVTSELDVPTILQLR